MAVIWTPSHLSESYTAALTSILSLDVIRAIGTRDGPPPPYRVTVFGARLKREFVIADEAKTAAVAFADRQLRKALETL